MPRPTQTPASNSDARKRNAERAREVEAATEDVIERAAYVREHLADYLRDWRMAACDHTIGMDREPCCSPCLRDRIIASGLLASPVRSGRSEAEIKAEALLEAADAMWLAKEPGHWHLRDPLDAYEPVSPDLWLERRAARIAGATEAEGKLS